MEFLQYLTQPLAIPRRASGSRSRWTCGTVRAGLSCKHHSSQNSRRRCREKFRESFICLHANTFSYFNKYRNDKVGPFVMEKKRKKILLPIQIFDKTSECTLPAGKHRHPGERGCPDYKSENWPNIVCAQGISVSLLDGAENCGPGLSTPRWRPARTSESLSVFEEEKLEEKNPRKNDARGKSSRSGQNGLPSQIFSRFVKTQNLYIHFFILVQKISFREFFKEIKY